ncbi:nuclear transport factor 2 family protein [Paracoccus cavernae]|uniref:Nuclear transport factor 2 family protein n=1 Tax=Paracoccus cavernae TaxID=1571207 RepID=A0ABT8D419_9RHOB|nr:nuclear transport factor 2 family protein [Paracoccus cavernae]
MSKQSDIELAKTLEEERRMAMQTGDADALEQMFDDELHYTHSFGNADSKADYIAKFRKGGFIYHELTCTVDTVVRRDDVLIVHGAMWSRATVAGQDRIIDNATSVVWSKTGGSWRLLVFAPTPIKR